MKLLHSATAAVAAVLVIAGCNSGSDSGDNVTVNGDVPITYTKRSTALRINPTDGTNSAAGGDLMVRAKSSPSATETNLTERFTQGNGDASDPEVSYDGKKIVFSMRCPASNTSTIEGQPACTGRWNIWEYDMTTGGLTGGTFRRITASTEHDDVDPAYLPAGAGFVFASNRQTKSFRGQALGRDYYALDEYERERVLHLHTMTATGDNITQITFNQSHDRNPVVRPNGDIMFARWEHLADRNRFAVFRVKPDGTDMFVLYGAQSPGNSFLHPRDMDPKGAYKGQVLSSLMPLSRTQEGGALMMIDAANYSEYNTPATPAVPAAGGQKQFTATQLNSGGGLSTFGRVTTPYPLWDGTDRVLVAFRPCEVTKNDVVVACASLTAEELATLSDETMTVEQAAAAPIKDNAPAAYSIYMFDPAKQTWLNVAAPPPGYMYVDPIAIEARPEPNALQPTSVDATLASQNLGLIEVRSVYDTDGLQRMGEPMVVTSDMPAGCARGIATKAPDDPLDTRAAVADLVKMKDPADPAYGCAPARFVRAIRAVPPPASSMGIRAAIGETDFEQQQILGYSQIEPDGSFKLHVPADVPIAFSVVDAEGRSFQTHTNWIQVRPGERRTCDGCHSPRRGGAINSGNTVNAMPAGIKNTMSSQHQLGETMAALRTRLEPATLALAADPVFTDLWADTTKTGVTAKPSVALRYTGNTDTTQDLRTAVPTNGVINYPQHIQPLWERDRGANTCTTCHNNAVKLDLRNTMAGTGRLVSYEELLLGDPLLDANGRPVTRLEDGVPVVQRGAALVETSSGAMNTAGQARKSRLTEIMFGQTLLAGSGARTAHPNPPGTAPNHATMLNAAEKRLIAEWMDLGGQYYNDPFNPSSGVRTVTALSQATFESQVMPVLQANCASACHQAIGSDRVTGNGGSFRENRYVLTGSAEGDYGATLAMISNTCQPALNLLLTKPSTVPHPAGATGQTAARLPTGSAGYTAIANWIASGCVTN
jgi:Hydrazine synthase alpha subunit middle domain